MRQTPERLRELYKLLQSKVHLKSIVMTLAVLVVFVTTYVLILPAFTLDKEEAAQQGGIDIVAEETAAMEAAEETAQPEAEEVKEEAAETASESAEATEEKADAQAEASEEKAETKAEAKEEKAEAKEDAKEEKAEAKAESKEEKASVKLLTKNKTLTAVTGKSDDVTVSAKVNRATKVPADVSLQAKELTKGTAGFDYDKHYEEVLKALGTDADGISMIKFYDISLESDMLDDSVEPSNTVNVKIAYDKGIKVSDADNIHIVHFGEEKTEVLDVDATVNSNNQLTEASFETDGFSVYAVVEEGNTGEYARMTVNFYNGESLIDTMYVKNKDSLDDLETILYDPGAGTLAEGEMFRGWTFNPNYTSADANSHYDSATDPDGLMTIEDIRNWADEKTIEENEEVNIYAMIFRHITVSYVDLPEYSTEDGDVSLGNSSIYLARTESDGEYTVSMPYTPHDGFHNFEGWRVIEGANNIVSATYTDDDGHTENVDITKPIQNGTKLVLRGDITLRVNAPNGNWLVFDENGKGGTYNAPQFLEQDEVAVMPNPENMIRTGFDFVGWYYNKEGTGEEFTGGTIDERTTVYAKWIPKTHAPYKVLIYQQTTDSIGKTSLGEDDYTLVNSISVDNGTVGNNIPYTFHNNGDEDYVTVQGEDYHLTGFCFQQPTEQVEITADGQAVLKLYFNRIKYNLRFYLYWRQTNAAGTGDNGNYYYGNNSNAGNNIFGVVNAHSTNNANNLPSTTRGTQTAVVRSVAHGTSANTTTQNYYKATYFVLSAYYGEDISTKWATYDEITGVGNNAPVSFVMMNGTKLKQEPTSSGSGTVKGIVQTMDENILGATADVDGNFLVVRFNQYNNWTYHVYYETIPGESYDETVTCTYNGKTYYWDHDDTSRSSNTQPWSQNASSYEGYTPVVWRDTVTTGNGRHEAGKAYFEYITTNVPIGTGGNYHGYNPELNYYYDRLSYQVNYHDGVYVDASGNVLESGEGRYLTDSYKEFEEKYDYDATIPENARTFDPSSLEEIDEAHRNEYVFEGWYFDQACEIPYTWGKMPIDGVKVYAKWRQKQYRAFLHPNVPDESKEIDWGSDSQNMNFRITYGGTVSLPEGRQEGYEMVGWYKDPECTEVYEPSTKLTDGTTSGDYVKTRDWTDPMDEYGNIGENPSNADVDRFWISRKIELYGKWRQIMIGAKGISVIYDPGEGQGEPTDDTLYLDNAAAVAQPAPTTPPEGKVFRYWVLQKWDPSANNGEGAFVDVEPLKEVVPGDTYTVLLANARQEELAGHTEDNPKYKYTIQLRAEYGNAESLTPTHIDWYKNYGSDPQSPEYSNAGKDGKGLKINEAVDIYTPNDRDGYRFVGWARVPVTISNSREMDGHTVADILNQDDIESEYMYLYYFDGKYYLDEEKTTQVSEVAADEETPYHDMYAVWEKKNTLTVKKIVESSNAEDKNTSFEFTPEVLVGGEWISGAKFNLKDGESEAVYDELSLNDSVKVTETANDNFDVKLTGEYTDENGQKHTLSNLKNGEAFTILGDTEITVTNTKKTQFVKIKKTDAADSNLLLGGATFTIGDDITLVTAKEGADKGFTDSAELLVGEYIVYETVAPDGYNLPENTITIRVNSDGVDYRQSNDNAGQWLHAIFDENTGSFVITITNTAGNPLPYTGGIGTTIFYILGSILVIGCGIVLVSRKRMGSNK